MPDSLYRSHSIEKSSSDSGIVTSGALTLWEDNPQSPLDVGDTFSPVSGGPLLTVKKVNISDNVVGLRDGKPFRQWQISIEGDNSDDAPAEAKTRILYNFSFNADGHEGTMEVANTGSAPAISLDIGDKFNVPGIGRIPCVSVRGSDSYDDNGRHIWTVTYEGSDIQETTEVQALPLDKYSYSIEKVDGSVVHSGSLSVAAEGDAPPDNIQVGSTLSIPGLGSMTCTKISGSDDYTEAGARFWTVTYEGSDAADSSSTGSQGEPIPHDRFTLAISGSGNSVKSGSMQVVNEGASPNITLNVGGKFLIPGLGNVTCTNISASDDYTDSGNRRWTVTYEGSTDTGQSGDSSSSSYDDHDRYSFSAEEGDIYSGSLQVISYGTKPDIDYSIGDSITFPVIGSITCTGYSCSDEYTDDDKRRWTVTYSASNASSSSESSDVLPPAKYSLSFDKDSEGLVVKSGSITIVSEAKGSDSGENDNGAPPDDYAIGSEFSIPGNGKFICCKISGSDEYTESGAHRWTMTYEGYPKPASETSAHDEETLYTRYSFTYDKDEDSNELETATMECAVLNKKMPSHYSVGGSVSINDGSSSREYICTKAALSDSYTQDGRRKWIIVYDLEPKTEDSPASPEEPSEDDNAKYSFSIEQNSDGIYVYSGTKEFTSAASTSTNGTSDNDNPRYGVKVGETFNVPEVGTLTCTNVRGAEDGSGNWTYILEGSRVGDDGEGGGDGGDEPAVQELPDDEVSVSYELNGTTVRTVDGELIALRRSEEPILRKSIVTYSTSGSPLTVLGDSYKGGIAISESIIKETVTVDGSVKSSHYKHTIEVEGTGSGSQSDDSDEESEGGE